MMSRVATVREVPRSRLERVSWQLTPRQQCDLELLAGGGFAPLVTFLGRADYESVCERMRLVDGTLWPIPVVLDVPEAVVRAASRSGTLGLSDQHGIELATLEITEVWHRDRAAEASDVLGTTDRAHPSVVELERGYSWCVTGQLAVRHFPSHPELPPLVRTAAEVRTELARRGWDRVVAFNTRNPMHCAHRALVMRAAESEDACVLVHPVVGVTRPGDVPAAVRARCYQALMRTLPADRFLLSLVPLAMRMAGPREALWHAIIRKNHGATAFIVGRDHAGPGLDSRGKPFYDAYAGQRLVTSFQDELGIRAVCSPELVYVDGLGYLPVSEVPPGRSVLRVSGTRLRTLLEQGLEIPSWLAPPEVVAELVSLPAAG
jgi:ATP sulfurylase